MYKISLVTIGSQKKSPYREISDKYQKFLKSDVNLKNFEVTEIPFHSKNEREKITKIEGEKINKVIPKNSFVIVMDAAGKTFTSEKFAAELEKWSNNGTEELVFIIGGPLGLSDEIKKEADLLLSLSPMTMPHDLARVVLLEQIYRATTILRGKVYHY